MLYAAYGMNTNISNMRSRCPNATLLGKATLLNFELRFRGHADIQFSPGIDMDVVLWDITEECLQQLDILEGYPDYYITITTLVEFQGELMPALVYIMSNPDGDYAPAESYYNYCMEGYLENGLDPVQLSRARELTKMYECY